jgi:diamine N-acetyltransferase
MWLSNICLTDKNADLFIAIWDDDYRGRGVGKIALKWLIDHAFVKLELHKIKLWVVEDNIPAVKLYAALGFEVEWKMKDEVFHDWKWHHYLQMAIFNQK